MDVMFAVDRDDDTKAGGDADREGGEVCNDGDGGDSMCGGGAGGDDYADGIGYW